MAGHFFISADLAQMNDFTAITIIERPSSWADDSDFRLRHIERPARGTSYPSIVERLKELAGSNRLDGIKTVVIDITGVGRPVWDLMRRAGFNARLSGILITGGNNVTRDGEIFSVPKRDLISALQVALQNGRLKIAPGLAEAETLVRELTNFKVKISLSGHDQYGAGSDWREGVHDDIVLSTAMGVWLAGRDTRNVIPSSMRL